MITFRAQTPTAMLVPHRVVLEQRAEKLCREQRVALGVSKEVRHELAARLATKHARDPLADLRLGEPGQRDLAEAFVAQQSVAPLQRLAARVLCAHRGADEDSIEIELPHHVLEHVPCPVVRPLQILEDDEDRTYRRGEPQERDDFVEQHVLRHLRLAARLGQQLHELRELALVFRAHRSDLLDHLGPRRERRFRVGLTASSSDELAGAQADFAPETPHERRFPHARLADDEGEIWSSLNRGFEKARERVPFVFAPDEVLKVDRRLERRLFAFGRRDHGVATAPLRFVERAIGGLEQAVEVCVVRPRADDADRQRHRDGARPFAQRNRGAADGGTNALGKLRRFVGRRVREQNDKLVAGVSRDDARRGGQLAQRTRDDAEHRVALQMPVVVVDLLEFVDVDDDERHGGERTALGEDLVRQLDERTARQYAGEVVVRAGDREISNGRAIARFRLDGDARLDRLARASASCPRTT